LDRRIETESRRASSRRNFLGKLAVLGLGAVALSLGQDSIVRQVLAENLSAGDKSWISIPRIRPSVYRIFGGPTVAAQNGVTDQVDFAGPDAASVIQQAMTTVGNNGKIMLQNGTYTLSRSLVGNTANGVEFCGQGESTVLRLANAVNDSPIRLQLTQGWYIHDLQIDGNRMNQSQNRGSPATEAYGINAWRTNGLTISNCHIHDCRCFGIGVNASSSVKLLNNYVQNCDANGISVGNEGEGSDTLISGNLVDSASDVGISAWDGVNVNVDNNVVKNVNMNRTPWVRADTGSHIGVMAEGNTFSQNCTYTNNTIINCGDGMSSDPGGQLRNKGIVFANNTVLNCLRAAYVNVTQDVTITNNIFDGLAQSPTGNTMYGALRLDPQVGTATISSNQFKNVGGYVKGGAVISILSPSGTINNNVIDTYNKKYQAISAPLGWMLIDNTVFP
jgi:parallel beta-helix repeat protein